MEDSGRKRSRSNSKSSRKHLEPRIKPDGGVLDDDNEPTLGEKLEIFKLNEIEKKNEESKGAVPPTADSVHILLKQALRADDHAMLLECIYNQNHKVNANSVAELRSSDVIKLLNSLMNLIDFRGAVLACAIPWLKSLLLQHATGIMSQESSLMTLNSLYQFIDSRVATFQSALKVSSWLDFLYAGIVDEGFDEESQVIPVVYEDKSDEDESDGDMETDDEETLEEREPTDGSDLDVNDDVMSD